MEEFNDLIHIQSSYAAAGVMYCKNNQFLYLIFFLGCWKTQTNKINLCNSETFRDKMTCIISGSLNTFHCEISQTGFGILV